MNCFEKVITKFWETKKEVPFSVRSSLGDEVTYYASYFYRAFDEMPELEKTALKLAKGNVLDVGAGVGCHAKYLQKNNIKVDAIESSNALCDVMQKREIKSIIRGSIWDYQATEKYDTILLLMNGIGIASGLDQLVSFFEHLKPMLAKGGSILLDSADIAYLFDEPVTNTELPYYGEIEYQVSYKNKFDQPFPWLFLDFETLSNKAKQAGFVTELVKTGNENDYLAKLYLMR